MDPGRSRGLDWAGGGLIGLMVLVAAVALAVSGRYPQTIFDVVLGMNRWTLRVAAYAGLMTDQYPPFRLDRGWVAQEAPAVRYSPGRPAPAAGSWWPWHRPVLAAIAALIAASAWAGAAGLIWFSIQPESRTGS